MPDDLNALRHIEGFPIGEDADILALSDPPHYTAYPNPHVGEFIEKWGKAYDEATDDYHREPYVADVSEGKNDPIYNAHSYHTKVSYKAIIPFIERYTEPGDIVFDGFCSTGMTGVAAQMVGRRAILCDLSPVATFIAYNFNTPVDVAAFEREAKRILAEVEAECAWMYETQHSDGRVGRINYTVWSDVFLCPYCASEIIFWDEAVRDGEVSSRFSCPDCGASVTKRELSRVVERTRDRVGGDETLHTRQVPVLINYSLGSLRYEKRPDAGDLACLQKIEAAVIPYWHPTEKMMFIGAKWGDSWRAGYHTGITRVHHFYMRRSLWTLARLWASARGIGNPRVRKHVLFWIHSVTPGFSALNRYLKNAYSQVNRMLSGTLYLGSTISEVSPWYSLTGKIPRIARAAGLAKQGTVAISTSSSTAVAASENSVDYIFTDPPFGDNLMYSELNFLSEAWLRAFTNTKPEAIMNETQKKGLEEYRGLMTECFTEMSRILKPGRWITVVFHNSRASVWNAIQEALARAGFLVAQVTVLDKQQGTIKQITSPGAVKNDLVINAYKPRAVFTQRFISLAGHGLEADFVSQHLRQLPLTANVERSREMLYSKYLAYYVQHGYQVAYNGDQFYRALAQWGLVERDTYWFADEAQANEYEARKAAALAGRTRRGQAPLSQAVLFISDERSARQWLWALLATPHSYGDIYTAYVRALQTSEDELPELGTMLEEGFMPVGGMWRRPDALTQAELEQRRQRRLLEQFEEYLQVARAGGRLPEVRKEALVAGFTEAYRGGRYEEILAVGRRLPKRLLEDSPEVFDFVDIAEAKVEG